VLRDPFLWLAGVISILVAFPWYYAVHIKTGGAYTSGFFLDHNINRFSAEREGHGGPFFVTILIVLLGMLPVSFLALSGLQKRFQFLKQPLYLFSSIVVGVYVLFFSISSTKLPNYPMPCYPFVAILAGYLLRDVFEGRYKIPKFIWSVWLLLSLAIPVGGFFALRNEPDVAHMAYFALFLLVLPIGVFIAFRANRQVKKSLFLLGASWMVFSAMLLWMGYPAIYKVNPVSKLSPLIEENARVLAYRAYNPAFNFNSKKERMIIPMARSLAELDSLHMVENRNLSLNGANQNIYLITRLQYLDELKETGYIEIGRNKDLFELPITVILVRRPK
jgi:4-amino-4-deoxy-L-arabinose transferase-like glycosyltransferase